MFIFFFIIMIIVGHHSLKGLWFRGITMRIYCYRIHFRRLRDNAAEEFINPQECGSSFFSDALFIAVSDTSGFGMKSFQLPTPDGDHFFLFLLNVMWSVSWSILPVSGEKFTRRLQRDWSAA